MSYARTVKAIALALLFITAAVMPTAAQSDSGLSDLVGDAAEDRLGQLRGAVSGLLDRAMVTFGGDDSDETAAEAANQTQEVFNGNATAIQSYVNNRASADTSRDVFAFTFEIDGESSTVYLTADVVDGAYENTSVVDSTDRSVDDSCTFEGYAARSADEELSYFVTAFVNEDKNVTGKYIGRLGGRYSSDVSCSFDTES